MSLGSVLDRIVPSDENGGGAAAAGAERYARRALAGPLASLRPAVQAGLDALDAAAGGCFADLPSHEQDALLEALEAGELPVLAEDPATVFETLRDLALEGTFGDPRHGGNLGLVGWRLLSYPGPRMVVGPDEQRIDATPASADHSEHRREGDGSPG